jgi:hypothetical protein
MICRPNLNFLRCPLRSPTTRVPESPKGFVLIPVVLAIALVAVIAFMLNNQSVFEVNVTTSVTEGAEVEAVARAGLAHARWQIGAGDCQGDLTMTSVPFGPGGAYSYNGTINAGGGAASRYTFVSDRDSWIRQSTPDTNYGSDSALSVRNSSTNNRRALYHFDLSAIPVGAKVVSATLRIYAGQPDYLGDLLVHRITLNWDESSVTWNSLGNGYETSPYGSVSSKTASGEWVSANLTALAQLWVNDPGTNHGILLAATSGGLVSFYASREDSAVLQPYLVVTTADGDVSPVQISITGNLAPDTQGNSVQRTLTESNVASYQPLISHVVQNPGQIKDTWLNSARTALNYGTDPTLQIAESGAHRALFEFSLASLPPGSHIVSAMLELYAGSVASAGNLHVHRVTRSWEQGSCAGSGCTADGATWASWDGTNAWSNPGGDYDKASSASFVAVTAAAWHRWDITTLVRSWLSGLRPNYGLLLKSDQGVDVSYASSEDADPTHHPRLVIEYACECGRPCLAAQGSGNVLMVVADAANPGPADLARQALLESWGYAVQMIADEAGQGEFDVALGLQDVVYVSATVDTAVLGNKLETASIGVVSEAGGLNAGLGFASGSSWPVGNRIDITDNTHPVTELFPAGAVPIYDADMEGLAVSGTLSPNVQLLAQWGSSGTLAVLESGAGLVGGGTAAGRRFMLPFGRNVNWARVSNGGQLILQRALDWGMVAAAGPGGCDGTYRDDFNEVSYSGSDGTLSWSADWLETGDDGTAGGGDIHVTDDTHVLEIKNKSRYVQREFDLSGAGTATLAFDYLRSGLDDTGDLVAVQVSGDGGGSWSTLEEFVGTGNDANYVATSHDISAFVAPNTRIRFISSIYLGKRDGVFFDNVQITCAP